MYSHFFCIFNYPLVAHFGFLICKQAYLHRVQLSILFLASQPKYIDFRLGLLATNDAWSDGLLDCLDDQYHFVCPVCVPPGRGDYFVCFCALFRLPNVG